MSIDRLPAWLDQMLNSTRQARIYTEGMDKAEFLGDRRTQQAVILNRRVIGELSAKLIESETAFIAGHAEIPWASMRGMRHRIAHGYSNSILASSGTVQRAPRELQQQRHRDLHRSLTNPAVSPECRSVSSADLSQLAGA